MTKDQIFKLIEELAVMGNNGYLFLNYGQDQLGPADDEIELFDMLIDKHPDLLKGE